ncbi:NTP transferase domain-containing protein [Hephaestia sp. GCM10023244]|uniref:phosphocholine cytidylyltransferase family protein n=1 Tax=unclassified Hephaestia TaxID=2631281 RepID=UPI00207728CE|nr:phosphocholine cytidylyltransferase family protein [Hephaestia sp. MAHUQ-44]MCM8730057.1 phosphocholine cytidylyltransferase family protein [Hephaestia sp. MAHUQ-44]
MKGIILSAGNGSRLLPLTRDMPKCLVDVEGRTILDRQIAALAEAGVTQAVVVVGYRARRVQAHLDVAPPPMPVALVYNPFWRVASSIGSVWAARDHLDAPFVLMNGDTVFEPSVIVGAIRDAGAGLGLLVEPLKGHEQDDMLVEACDGRVRAVAKTLSMEHATHRSLGVVLAPRPEDAVAYRRALDEVIAAPDGTQSYHHDIVDWLAGTAGVNAIIRHPGTWQEIDRPADIARWTRERRPA